MFRTTWPRRAMVRPLRRRAVGVIAAVALGISTLSGCAAGQISQSVDQVPNQDSVEGTVGPIGVRSAIITGPTGDTTPVAYAKGANAPLAFWITNASPTASDTLAGISTPAGTVKISGTATVEPDAYLQVGGTASTVSATITGLKQDIKYGVSIPITFSFAKAGTVSMNIPVSIPKERTGDRATTDLYPPEQTNIWGD